ncbi:hypothetical protein CR513_43348, partial [Mucuna pruriens]
MAKHNQLIRITKKVGRSQRKIGRGTPPSVMVISYHTPLYHLRNLFPINLKSWNHPFGPLCSKTLRTKRTWTYCRRHAK